jgi:hypothetical protein
MTLGTSGLDDSQSVLVSGTVSVSNGDLKTSLDNLKSSIDALIVAIGNM